MANGPGTLYFEYCGQGHEIVLTDRHAPVTVERLVESLPQEIDIHCAKIAGNHIFWHAPFLAPLERGADIMTLPAGTFLFWPERQFLELIFGELQAESAAVNVLGVLSGDIEWLQALGEANRRRQGREMFTATLRHGTAMAPARAGEEADDGVLASLRSARKAAWRGQPAEIEALLERRGAMLPFGPLAMAEGEMRKIHEFLWRLWADEGSYSDRDKAMIASAALRLAIDRVDGFCGLSEIGGVLREGLELLEGGQAPVAPTLEEIILYAGRIAAWLDLRICWYDMNEITLDALARRG